MTHPQEPLEITPHLVLRAYAAGLFPMAHSADSPDVFWLDPKMRGVLPLDGLHVPRSLAKKIRKGGFEVMVNHDFAGTVASCAERPETWINRKIFDLYVALHRMGHAHSVEVWRDRTLIGGLYGVALGAAFFGESMFSREPDGSKVALVYLVARLRAGGFQLLDTQFTTAHLERMGAREIPQAAYLELLDRAIRAGGDFGALNAASPDEVLSLVQGT